MRRTIFITGGSRGIGRAIVLEAVKEGYDVAFTFVANEESAKSVVEKARDIEPSAKVHSYQMDVRDSTQVDMVADQVLDEFGTIYGLVCNAGMSKNGLVFSITDEDWETVISTNLTGTFYVCRAFLPAMIAEKKGRIVIVSSITDRGATGQASYAASKSGLLGLCGCLTKEYGPKGITANIVLPGYFETDMTKTDVSDKNLNFALDFSPLRRAGSLKELARTVLFLTSEDAGYITGEAIRVAGGLGWVP